LLERDPAGSKLFAVGGVDVAIPEPLLEPKAFGETEDDVGVGQGLSGRGHDSRPELNVRLRVFADFKPDLESLAFEARCDGKHDVGKRGRRIHEEVRMCIKIQRRKCRAAANRISLGKQQIRAESNQRAHRIGITFENPSIEVMGRYVVPACGSERTFGDADGRRKSRSEVLPGDRHCRDRWE